MRTNRTCSGTRKRSIEWKRRDTSAPSASSLFHLPSSLLNILLSTRTSGSIRVVSVTRRSNSCHTCSSISEYTLVSEIPIGGNVCKILSDKSSYISLFILKTWPQARGRKSWPRPCGSWPRIRGSWSPEVQHLASWPSFYKTNNYKLYMASDFRLKHILIGRNH